MKKINLLFLFALLYSALLAQNTPIETNAQFNFNNDPLRLPAYTGHKHLALVGTGHHVDNAAYSFCVIEPDGSLKQQNTFWGQSNDVDILSTADGVIVSAMIFECDILVSRLSKYDYNGNVVWEQYGSLFFQNARLLPGPGNTFWLAQPDEPPTHFADNGDMIEAGPAPLAPFTDFVRSQNGYTVTFGVDGVRRYTSMLTVAHAGLPGKEVLKMAEIPGDRFVALTGDSLYVLNEYMEIQTVVAAPPTDIASIGVDSSRVVLFHNDPPVFYAYDFNLNLFGPSILLPTSYYKPKWMYLENGRVVLVGTETQSSLALSPQVLGIKMLPYDQLAYHSDTDAGVSSVSSTQQPEVTFEPVAFTPSYRVRIHNMTVQISNYGLTTLDKVTLNSVLSTFNYGCGSEEIPWRRTYDNLQLAPGATTNLTIDSLVFDAPVTSSVVSKVQYCFWTTMPNDQLDKDVSNNELCQNFTVSVKPPVFPLTFHIYPNPIVNTFHIGLPMGQYDLEWVDALGRVVRRVFFEGEATVLSREGLSSGVYLLRVTARNNGATGVQKVVVE